MEFNFDPNKTVTWCPECKRYYNPTAEHSCVDVGINENRAKLEQWLGEFTIKEG